MRVLTPGLWNTGVGGRVAEVPMRSRAGVIRAPPADGGEAVQAVAGHADSLGGEQAPLDGEISVATQASACSDHAVAGDARFDAAAHDVADGSPGERLPRQGRDVSVGRHPSRRNTTYDRQYPARKPRCPSPAAVPIHKPSVSRCRAPDLVDGLGIEELGGICDLTCVEGVVRQLQADHLDQSHRLRCALRRREQT